MRVLSQRIALILVAVIGVPGAALWLWELAANAEVIDPVFLPPPSSVFDALLRLVDEGTLVDGAWVSVSRTVQGWVLATVAGVAAGIALGRSSTLRAAFDPLVEFGRAIPAAAIVPIAVLLLGPDGTTEILVAALAGTWPILINAASAVRRTDPLLLDAARICGLSRWRQAGSVQLRAASAAILAGMRISLSVCFIVAVIVEMVGSTGGLGTELIEARSRYRNADVYAIVLTLGFMGVAVNGLVERAERHLARWQ